MVVGGEVLEKIVEEDESLARKDHHNQSSTSIGNKNQQLESLTSIGSTSVELGTTAPSLVPRKGPETQEFLESVRKSSDLLKAIQNQIGNLTGSDAALIDINKEEGEKRLEDCCEEASTMMESTFKLQAVEYEGTGEEEESMEEMTGEEAAMESADEDTDEEEMEEEEEDEEDDVKFDPAASAHDRKLPFGVTCHYCPVSLQTKGVLAPGMVDIQCKYREKLFRFVSDEARQQFMHAPEKFLPNPRRPMVDVPPTRILILGPRGSGERFIYTRYLSL